MQEFLYRIAESPAVQRLPHGKNLRRPDAYSIQDFLISKDLIPCSICYLSLIHISFPVKQEQILLDFLRKAAADHASFDQHVE